MAEAIEAYMGNENLMEKGLRNDYEENQNNGDEDNSNDGHSRGDAGGERSVNGNAGEMLEGQGQQWQGNNSNRPLSGNTANGGPTLVSRWNQGPNQASSNSGAPPAGAGQSPNGPPPASLELWVETKTADGKSYFYHALTRETTWNKPEGPQVKIMTQSEIEEMNKKQQQQHGQPQAGGVESKVDPVAATGAMAGQPNKQQQPGIGGPPPGIAQQPPPQAIMQQQPPPIYPQGGMHPPPNFSQPPFGMPPPGYGGHFPGAPVPWGGAMPWNQHGGIPSMAQAEKPAKNLIIKPGVIDPQVIARAAEWSEHRAPDGRPYYYHAGRGESVWEKPQALRDMEAARMAAHSGATPQQAAVAAATAAANTNMPPHMMPNPMMHMPPGGLNPYDPYNTAAAMGFNAAAVAGLKPGAAGAVSSDPQAAKAAQAAALEKERKAAEEKKRKEEAEKKAAASQAPACKPVDKSRPISSTPIAGTPWCVVWTGDARVFFYNPSTRTSVWERPEDLLDREDVDKAVNTPPEQLRNQMAGGTGGGVAGSSDAGADKERKPDEKAKSSSPEVEEDKNESDNGVIKIRDESDSDVEEIPSKKTKLATKQSKKADANEAAVEAEVRAAKERAVVPLETRIKQFKDMLREKDVSAFSTWEKELHKIVFDQRYLLLTSRERKQVFEKYVKDRAEEERKEKRNKMRQKREDFRKLMEEAKLHGKSNFSDFCQRFAKDERYRAIEKIRERESLFNEFIVDVRRREKEERIQKKEQIRKDFMEMLRERSDIDRHTRWHEIKRKFELDSRYKAVENSMYREEYFQEFMRNLKEEKRRKEREREREREEEKKKERERERERDRERRSERKDKDKDRKDKERRERSRSKGRARSKDKEDKDKEKGQDEHTKKDGSETEDHKDKTAKETDDEEHSLEEESRQSHSAEDEAERLRKEREKQLRAEQSIREREREVQRTLAGHLRDRDKEREHHKRDEAIGVFNALLADLVRNPDLAWKEAKRQLRKDHRWDMCDSLDRDDREKLFNEHINALMKKKREKFREMLDEISSLELTSTWKDIKKLVKDDPRYLKYNNTEKCEREFRDYMKDKIILAKAALRELLQECKLITHKSHEVVKENPNHLKEIQDILKNDKRYLVLDYMGEERTEIVLNYLEELHKRGPPPPPTASESTRRHK